MPRFVTMLHYGMLHRGHKVTVWKPNAVASKFPLGPVKKWLAYIDQYVIFPLVVKKKIKSCAANTLFVFADQALGPWVHLVADRFHIIHCHDFLAQRSALGEIPQNPTGFSGQLYQKYIRKGYRRGRNFISVSNKTRQDLSRFLTVQPKISAVVYNGLNQQFRIFAKDEAAEKLSRKFNLPLSRGFLLHVGGNDWYKNRYGLLQLYFEWRSKYNTSLPLLCIGFAPDDKQLQLYQSSPFKNDVYFLQGVNGEYLNLAYVAASVFIFPSLAEGFGWPIAEAMACGCPVITTNQAPMSEVAGDAGFFIDVMPPEESGLKMWLENSARVLQQVLQLSDAERLQVVQRGIENAKRFDTDRALDNIESIYKSVLAR